MHSANISPVRTIYGIGTRISDQSVKMLKNQQKNSHNPKNQHPKNKKAL